MAYGLQLLNNFNENPLASGGLLFESSSGTMSWVPHASGYYGQWGGSSDWFRLSMNLFVNNHSRRFCAGMYSWYPNVNKTLYYLNSAGTAVDSWKLNANGRGSPQDSRLLQWSSGAASNHTKRSHYAYGWRHAHNAVAISGTTGNTLSNMQQVFFKLPTNGLHTFGTWYNPYANLYGSASQGIVAFVQGWYADGDGQEYKVLTTQTPSVSGTYGLQVLNDDGSVRYDSRYTSKAARIKAFVHISESDMNDCLTNGTTYNYPLRQNVANPWIGGDTLNSQIRVLSGRNSTWHYPRLQIVNINGVDNLRLSRTFYRYVSKGTMNGPYHSDFNAGTYLIADM